MGGILNSIYRSIDGIDFEGQKQQNIITYVVLLVSALVWLMVGWTQQDFGLTVQGMLGILGIMVVVSPGIITR